MVKQNKENEIENNGDYESLSEYELGFQRGTQSTKKEVLKIIDKFFKEVEEPKFEVETDKYKFIKWICEMQEELKKKISQLFKFSLNYNLLLL